MVNQKAKTFVDLSRYNPEVIYSYGLYRQTMHVYRRSKAAMGQTTYRLLIADTKNAKVRNDANHSSKIYSGK